MELVGGSLYSCMICNPSNVIKKDELLLHLLEHHPMELGARLAKSLPVLNEAVLLVWPWAQIMIKDDEPGGSSGHC